MRKKLVSFAAALAIAASALTGLTAVTASAEGEPSFDTWVFHADKSGDFDFSQWTEETKNVLQNYNKQYWQLCNSSGVDGGSTFTKYDSLNKANASMITIKSWSQLRFIKAAETSEDVPEPFYYQYEIYMPENSSSVDRVYLSYSDNAKANLVFNNTNVTYEAVYKTYTTVVVPESKTSGIAYTYMPSGTVISTAYNKALSGITFEGNSGAFTVKSFSYGTANERIVKDTAEIEDYKLSAPTYYTDKDAETTEATEPFSALTASTTASHGDWTGSREFNNSMLSIGDNIYLRFTYGDRWLQYNKANSSGLFYYTYKIGIKGQEDTQRVYIVTDSGDKKISSLVDDIEEKKDGNEVVTAATMSTYTTLVDNINGVAYTFREGEFLDKIIFDGSATGIKFANNFSSGTMNYRIYSFAYGTAAEKLRVEATNPKWEGVYEPDGFDPTAADANTKQATAYSAQFALDSGQTYTDSTVTWELNFATTYEGATGVQRLTVPYGEVKAVGDTKYGFVIKDMKIGKDDAQIDAVFRADSKSETTTGGGE